MKKILLFVMLASAVLSACQKNAMNPDDENQDGTFDPCKGWPINSVLENKVESFKAPEPPFEYSITYEYDKEDFCNPERGSYAPLEYHFRNVETAGYPTLYTLQRLQSCRASGCTLHYLGIYLCDYLESDIPEEALNIIRAHIKLERQTGTKITQRHANT